MKTRFAALSLIVLTSCASMFANQKPLMLTSNPTGASWKASDGQRGITPSTYTPHDYQKTVSVTFTKEGYVPQTLQSSPEVSWWVVGNALFGLVGLAGIVLDVVNEGAWVYYNNELHAELAPGRP